MIPFPQVVCACFKYLFETIKLCVILCIQLFAMKHTSYFYYLFNKNEGRRVRKYRFCNLLIHGPCDQLMWTT